MSNIDEVRARFEAAEAVDPDTVPAAGGGDDGGPPPRDEAPAEDGPPEAQAAPFPLNDYGNGRRFAVYFGEDTMFVPRVGWFMWTDGRVWSKDDDSMAVRRVAQQVSERMLGEIGHLRMPPFDACLVDEEPAAKATVGRLRPIPSNELEQDQRVELAAAEEKLGEIQKAKGRFAKRKDRHRSHANSTGNSAKIDAMLKEAGVALSRAFDEVDAAPLDVNTDSGVLRFAVSRDEPGSPDPVYVTMDHLRHDERDLRDERMTKIMPVEYDPGATCKTFDAFLERIQPDPEMQAFLQRWFGLSMTALTGDQKLVFLYGAGANGKSVLIDLMARILGDYAATAKIESLTGQSRRGGGDATPDLVPLMGARLVRASEPEQGERLKEGIIKELTGGEPILVRALHSDFVQVKPKFKLTISGNHKPEIRGTDDGIWRRVLLTPFEVQIPPDERDPDLGEKLWAERAGVLNWLIAGLRDYLAGGLREPESVLEATQAYREDSDPLHVFLTDVCEVTGSEHDFTPSRELIEAFNFWLEERGETRWGGRTVSNRLKDKANRWHDPATGKKFIPAKYGVTGYRGVRLTPDFKRRLAAETQSGGGDDGRDRGHWPEGLDGAAF